MLRTTKGKTGRTMASGDENFTDAFMARLAEGTYNGILKVLRALILPTCAAKSEIFENRADAVIATVATRHGCVKRSKKRIQFFIRISRWKTLLR